MILYTSGTTGRSKGAMLSHRNLSSNADVLASYWRFTDRDVLLHALPLYHTHGLFTAAITLMLAGGTMLFLPKFDADEVIRLLPRATAMMGVPTYYTRLLQHPGFDPRPVRPYAAVHLRLRAAARRDASRVRRAHRPRHSRTLRHDRDRHEHLESL